MKEKKNIQNSKLRQAREQRGWTQKVLADNICLPDTRLLRRWECGEVVPSLRYRARLCEIFEMSAEDLGILPEHDGQITEMEELPSEHLSRSVQPTPVVIASTSQAQAPASPSLNVRNRFKLLEKVSVFWINEVLEQSLYGSAPLALELHIQPDAVTSPWDQVIHRAQKSVRLVPPGTLIHQIYDGACGELLILGAPGSGKTTLLLDLARSLLQRAFADETHPMPVVFNLSSWSRKRLPLASWLIEELSDKYHVPEQIGRAWVENDHLLPLLDGLDEVSPALREACVDTITTYRREHGFVPLVVCSRKDEYLNLAARLLLQRAVCIQPLARQHIDIYFSNEGVRSEALRDALRDDASLQQLVTTPLMLSVLTTAYQGESVEELKALESLEERRRRVFATYVERMLTRRKPERRYTVQQSRRWLAYLAQQMLQHRQTEFNPEYMQLDWLPTRRSQQICYGLLIGLQAGLVSGMLVGLVAMLLKWGIMILLFLGLFSLLNARLLDGFLSKKLDEHLLVKPHQGIRYAACYAMWHGLAVGLLNWLMFTIAGVGIMRVFPDLIIKLDFMIFAGLAFSLLIVLVIGLNKGGKAYIKHLILRVMLWFGGYIPWNYPRFLDYATERILLHKTAGGYMFIHQMLLEYFALDTQKK